MQIKLFFLSLIFLVLVTDSQLLAQDWVLKKDKKGIQVFTRKVEGHAVKEYKVTITLKTTVAKLTNLLKDHANFQSWFVRCPVSKRLKKVSENEYYIYFLVDAPWPVSDRDNITQMVFELLDNGTQLIHLKAVSDYIPEKPDLIRITKLKGKWMFEPQANGMVKVTQQILADPAGKIPAWLTNFALVDAPFKAFCNLREEVKK
jgi:hypothetical protein